MGGKCENKEGDFKRICSPKVSGYMIGSDIMEVRVYIIISQNLKGFGYYQTTNGQHLEENWSIISIF